MKEDFKKEPRNLRFSFIIRGWKLKHPVYDWPRYLNERNFGDIHPDTLFNDWLYRKITENVKKV